MEAAERWSMPPWELEAQAPDIWMERAAIWHSAKVERASKPPKAPVGQWQQRGNRRVKRLV